MVPSRKIGRKINGRVYYIKQVDYIGCMKKPVSFSIMRNISAAGFNNAGF